MEAITTDKQKNFEAKVAKIFKINDYLMQRNGSEQMIIDDLRSTENYLSGTIGYKRNNGDIILIATKDSEVNHIESITLDMIKIMVEDYCEPKKRKVIFATNIPIDIHSSKAKDLQKEHKFYIKNIGYSFCQKHNLEFTQMY
jgi:hypothetical protein